MNLDRPSASHIETVLTMVCKMLVALSAVGIMVNIVGRQFGISVVWMNTVTAYLLVWVTFLYAGVLTYQDDHIKISFIIDKLPDTVQVVVEYARLLIILGFGVVLLYVGWLYAIAAGFIRNIHSTQIPMYWAYVSLPLGGVMIIFFTGVIIYKGLKNRRTKPVNGDSDVSTRSDL